ncbi:MAG TPA: hypothetical protein VM118_12885, partial [Acidobacteriota bacterium]|nr:hypothetical protein [Acidobacteriota bacterium]
CSWDFAIYGGTTTWRDADLDQNGTREWAKVNPHDVFRVFPDPECDGCNDEGLCPAGLCSCACHGDPQCDSVTNVLDVVAAVDVAFRNVAPEPDPLAQCPVARTDVDCSGFTNVLDVVHFVNVAFRGGDPGVEFCDPCP